MTAAAAAAAVATATASAAATELRPTPPDMFGPYYPPEWSGEIDADLADLGGRAYQRGTALQIGGQVLAVDGQPITSATVEIWQADETGKYRHPDDDRDGPALRGFQGFGRTVSDAQGRYGFRTIKPAMYGGRPPHVHFRVVAPGYRTLVTQMYFEGESRERGWGGGFARERDRLTVKTTQGSDDGRAALAAQFDLILAR